MNATLDTTNSIANSALINGQLSDVVEALDRDDQLDEDPIVRLSQLTTESPPRSGASVMLYRTKMISSSPVSWTIHTCITEVATSMNECTLIIPSNSKTTSDTIGTIRINLSTMVLSGTSTQMTSYHSPPKCFLWGTQSPLDSVFFRNCALLMIPPTIPVPQKAVIAVSPLSPLCSDTSVGKSITALLIRASSMTPLSFFLAPPHPPDPSGRSLAHDLRHKPTAVSIHRARHHTAVLDLPFVVAMSHSFVQVTPHWNYSYPFGRRTQGCE